MLYNYGDDEVLKVGHATGSVWRYFCKAFFCVYFQGKIREGDLSNKLGGYFLFLFICIF